MGCNCKWLEIIIAIVILIVTIWSELLGTKGSWWVTIIAAILLLLHAFMCKNCGTCATSATGGTKVKAKKNKKK